MLGYAVGSVKLHGESVGLYGGMLGYTKDLNYLTKLDKYHFTLICMIRDLVL